MAPPQVLGRARFARFYQRHQLAVRMVTLAVGVRLRRPGAGDQAAAIHQADDMAQHAGEDDQGLVAGELHQQAAEVRARGL